MTNEKNLRDELAIAALIGILAKGGYQFEMLDFYAASSYACADAMLKARDENHGQ